MLVLTHYQFKTIVASDSEIHTVVVVQQPIYTFCFSFIITVGPYSISQEMCCMEVTSSTPISMFLPANSGQGRCALALNNFLVTLHNDFIGRCKSLLKDESRYVYNSIDGFRLNKKHHSYFPLRSIPS